MKQPAIKQLHLVIAIAILFSSCATIMNQQKQNLMLTPGDKIQLLSATIAADTLRAVPGKSVHYSVKRNKQPILLHLKIDSAEKTVVLQAKKSFAYWFNIYGNYGLGMLIDRKTDKRFGYPASTYLSVKDSSIQLSRFEPIKKGRVDLYFSTSLLQGFKVNADKAYYSAGMFGIETGANYFYDNNRYISIRAGAASDAFAEYFGKGYVNRSDVLFTSVRNNYISNNFDIGYGLNLSKFIWRNITIGDTINLDKRITNLNLGASLAAHYIAGKNFRAGILFQPTIFNLNKERFEYQYNVSLNFGWKIRIKGHL